MEFICKCVVVLSLGLVSIQTYAGGEGSQPPSDPQNPSEMGKDESHPNDLSSQQSFNLFDPQGFPSFDLPRFGAQQLFFPNQGEMSPRRYWGYGDLDSDLLRDRFLNGQELQPVKSPVHEPEPCLSGANRPLDEHTLPALIRLSSQGLVQNEEDEFASGSKKIKIEDSSRPPILIDPPLKKEEDILRYKCQFPKCSQTRETTKELRIHEATHRTNRGILLCPQETCRRPYKEVGHLFSHDRLKHENPATEHLCPYLRRINVVGNNIVHWVYCKEHFSTEELLKDHFDKSHRLNLTEYLRTAVAIYEGEDPKFPCNHCRKGNLGLPLFFTTQEHLEGHLKRDHFVCPICEAKAESSKAKSFKAESYKALKDHLSKEHTNEFQYRCVCGKYESNSKGGYVSHKLICKELKEKKAPGVPLEPGTTEQRPEQNEGAE